jgi:hypothetical protein
MRTLIIVITILTILVACEKSSNTASRGYTAKISGFDLNCSTCILSFPLDSVAVSKQLGKSPGNLYHAVNLNRNDLQLGQIVKVEVRKAEPEELRACITLYPSLPYESIFVTKVEDIDSFSINDTIELGYHECNLNTESQTYICLESVLNDSRCPTGAECIWAGDAQVRFKLVKADKEPVFFNLNTTRTFTNDTIINGYKFTLLNLSPYPSLLHHPEQKEYKAELGISNVSE